MVHVHLSLTGDPFVDIGGIAFDFFQKRYPKDTPIELIEKVANIYINQWNRKINSLFLNSKITNPSIKTPLQETMSFYASMENGDFKGFCKTCGANDLLFLAGRDTLPLSGSGSLVNFHYAWEKGTALCASCHYKLFFVPLSVLILGGKLSLLQAFTKDTKKLWCALTVEKNFDQLTTGSSQGLLKSEYTNVTNALFYFAIQLIEDMKDRAFTNAQSLTLYHFTNFASDVGSTIYCLNESIFMFLAHILNSPTFVNDWKRFVLNHYYKKGITYDEENQQFYKLTKKRKDIIDSNDYQNFQNTVYRYLLAEKSITRLLLKQQEKDYMQNKEKPFPVYFANIHAWEILGMTKEQTDILKRIVEKIFTLSDHQDKLVDLQKVLKEWKGIKSKAELRRSLIKLCEINRKADAKEPFITLDDVSIHLLNDRFHWGEVRDYFLIYFYELLHQKDIALSSVVFEEELAEVSDEEFVI